MGEFDNIGIPKVEDDEFGDIGLPGLKKKASSKNGLPYPSNILSTQSQSNEPEIIPSSGFVTIASRSRKQKGVVKEQFLSQAEQKAKIEEKIGAPKQPVQSAIKDFSVVKAATPERFMNAPEKLAALDLTIPKEKLVISDDNQYSSIINNPDKTAEEFEAAIDYSVLKTKEFQQQARDEEKARETASKTGVLTGKEGFAKEGVSKAVDIPKEGITENILEVEDNSYVGALEYMVGKGYNESTIGLADAMLNRQYRIDPEILAKYSPSWIEDATASTIGLLMDTPLFIASGGVGAAAVRQMGKLAVKSYVEKGVEKELAKELVASGMKKAAGKYVSGALQTGATLGTFGFTKDAMTQLANPEVSFSDWDYGQSLNRFGKDFALGLTVGGISTGFKFVSDAARAIESDAGRIATQLALRPTALAAENAAFIYEGKILDGQDIKDVSSQDFVAGAMMIWGAGSIGLKQSTKNLVKSFNFKPEKAGNGEFKVDFSNDDLKILGVESNESAVKLGQNIGALPTILKNENIPALTKAKLLYTSHGIKMEGDLLADGISLINENTIEIKNKEGILLDRTEYSSPEDARNNAILTIKKIDERKWRDEVANMRPKIVSEIQSDLMADKKFSFEELNNALDVPLENRTSDQNSTISKFKYKIQEYKEKEAKNAITQRKEEFIPEYKGIDGGVSQVGENRTLAPEKQGTGDEASGGNILHEGAGIVDQKVAETSNVDVPLLHEAARKMFPPIKRNVEDKYTGIDFLKSGVIMPEGDILDFSYGGRGGRELMHEELSQLFEPGKPNNSKWIRTFLDSGGIRMAPESGAFEMVVRPTESQLGTMGEYISLVKGQKIKIDIPRKIYAEYKEGTSAEQITNDIRDYYDKGIVPKEWIDFSSDIVGKRVSDIKSFVSDVINSENYDKYDQLPNLTIEERSEIIQKTKEYDETNRGSDTRDSRNDSKAPNNKREDGVGAKPPTESTEVIQGEDIPSNNRPSLFAAKANEFRASISMPDVFTKKIKESLADRNLGGKLTKGQVNRIVNYARKVKSETTFNRFLEYADKVVQLKDIGEIQSKLKKSIKSKAAKERIPQNNLQTVKEFLKINPFSLNNPTEYLDIANKLAQNQKSVKVESVSGKLQPSKESAAITNDEVNNFIDKARAEIEETKKKELVEDYADLVDQGLIDPEKMSLKDMQDIISATKSDETFDEFELSLTKDENKQKEDYLKEFVKYKMFDLDSYDTEGLTPKENHTLADLKKINTVDLSLKQLTMLNDIIDNIQANNDFSGAGRVSIIGKLQDNLSQYDNVAKNIGIKNLGGINNIFVEGLTSKDIMIENITKDSKLAAELKRFIGIDDIFNGNARSKNLQSKLIDDYNNVKKSLSKDIDSPENRITRGILDRIGQNKGGTSEEIKAEFDRVKGWIEESGNRLSASDVENEQKEGKVILEVYNKILRESNNEAEVRSKVSLDNQKLIDFFRDKHAERLDLVRESTEIDNNKPFEEVQNYSATKLKSFAGKQDLEQVEDLFKDNYFGTGVTTKEAKSKISRTAAKTLRSDRVLDLDYDRVQIDSYAKTNYDIEVSPSINLFREFIKNAKADEILGGSQNKNILTETIKSSINSQRGQSIPLGRFEKLVLNTANLVQAKGMRLGLASGSQLLKQYPSVAINTIGNLGSDAGLFFTALRVPNNLKLFDLYNISQRGSTKAGYERDLNIESIDKAQFGNDLNKVISHAKKISDKVSESLFKSLVNSDVSVARTSWLSYYMKDLQRQGKSIDIDWKNEHLNPNEEAASYAEQMVARNQNANDPSSMPNWYKSNGSGWGAVVRNVTMPFSSFALNARMKMTLDAKKILYGGNKNEAVKSLVSTALEQTAFNALKVYLISSATTAGAGAIMSAFGIDQPDKNSVNKLKTFAGNTANDIFFGGIGTLPNYIAVKGLNTAYALVSQTVSPQADYEKNKPQLIFQYNPKNKEQSTFGEYGIYGVLPKKLLTDIPQITPFLDGKTDKYTKGTQYRPAKIEPAYLTDNEHNLATMIFMIDALAIAGVSDADVSMINTKMRAKFLKAMSTKYGSQMDIKVKVPGAGKYYDAEKERKKVESQRKEALRNAMKK